MSNFRYVNNYCKILSHGSKDMNQMNDYYEYLKKTYEFLEENQLCKLGKSMVPKKYKLSILELLQKINLPDRVYFVLKNLLNANRINLLPEIIHKFREYLYLQQGYQLVYINSSKDLTEKDLDNLKEIITLKLGGKPFKICLEVDEKLIAGLKIKTSGSLIDLSAANILNSIRRSLQDVLIVGT